MKQTLFYNSDDLSLIHAQAPWNKGIGEVLARIEELQRAGMQVVDTVSMSDEQRTKEYFGATLRPSARKKYRVRVVFGRAGSCFGKGVPGLVVRENGMIEDVYPHENKATPGQYITINDFLNHAKR